ncbi:MAG TPA: poly-beta-1,6-N-acetyl-D-glucosamine biosynthesis protein PgaD [Thermoanaerobaculia bacterium]|jgi:biofilm PGA synthesis protein PgaD|nr:poly-beta-1,6-N-acetyl-D-glucosamine biosynthesis protein PgaD [Thermoanaerobaculia bacterium]
MPSGAARIDEASTIAELRRRGSRGKPLPAGMLGVLTVVCWAVWIYLVLPLLSLFLWVTGVRLFVRENPVAGYHALAATLLAYSSTLVILVGLLAIWIFWNVARYAGKLDRRTVKRPEVASAAVWKSFRVDASIGQSLRAARSMRVDLDRDGCLVVVAEGRTAGSNGRRDPPRRVLLQQPRAQAVVHDRADAIRPRVREVKEVVKER